jgi:hypothetical protein
MSQIYDPSRPSQDGTTLSMEAQTLGCARRSNQEVIHRGVA